LVDRQDNFVDRRTKAREIAMQSLFQLDVQGSDMLDQISQFIKNEAEDEMVFSMARQWAVETWNNIDACDELIKTAATKWDLTRLSSVDRSILRLSAYQMKFCPDIPGKVIINEAIEIAKKYSGVQSPGFVNGVLDAILKSLQGDK